MHQTSSIIVLTLRDIEAVFFDLDGVITQTAALHIIAWKELFDDYLKARADRVHTFFRPFDAETACRRHADSKPRYDGVKSFLESRDIALPYGDTSDMPDQDTICGIGKRI